MTRHVWADELEEAEENRYTHGIRDCYKLRKETIERDFALAKELHGFRYTQEYGQARMKWKAALTYVSNFICHISAFPEENAVLGLSLGRHLSTV